MLSSIPPAAADNSRRVKSRIMTPRNIFVVTVIGLVLEFWWAHDVVMLQVSSLTVVPAETSSIAPPGFLEGEEKERVSHNASRKNNDPSSQKKTDHLERIFRAETHDKKVYSTHEINTKPALEQLEGLDHGIPSNSTLSEKTIQSNKQKVHNGNEEEHLVVPKQECWISKQQIENHNGLAKKCHIFDDVQRNTTIFLHVGKGGGGTVDWMLEAFNVTGFGKCHPKPEKCLDLFFPNTTTTTTETNTPKKSVTVDKPNVLINIRDPVDRFQSAFNWRALLFCRPPKVDQRTRRPVGSRDVWERPHEHCFDVKRDEKRMIQKRYQSNVNILAESLCPPPIMTTANESSAAQLSFQQAKRHTLKIQHMNRHLVDWMDLLGIRVTGLENQQQPLQQDSMQYEDDNKTNLHKWFIHEQRDEEIRAQSWDKVYVLVLHPNVTFSKNDEKIANGTNEPKNMDFETVVEKALVHLVAASSPQGQQQQQQQQHYDKLGASFQGKKHKAFLASRFIHASSQLYPATGFVPGRLSPLGQCCATRWYWKDYRLLQIMLMEENNNKKNDNNNNNNKTTSRKRLYNVCHSWKDYDSDLVQHCRNGLADILRRREHYLGNNMSVPCQTLVTQRN